MTYNFDPERWYETRANLLELQRSRHEISEGEYRKALADLDRRYLDIVRRLDGSYQIPDGHQPG
jgi:hypothetical protein